MDINDLNRSLQQAEVELLSTASDYAAFALDAAQKRAQYDLRWAQELLKVATNKDVKLTVPEKEAMVTNLVQDELTACRIAEAMANASKAKLDALKSTLSSIQSRAALLKTEAFVANHA